MLNTAIHDFVFLTTGRHLLITVSTSFRSTIVKLNRDFKVFLIILLNKVGDPKGPA